MSRKIAETMSKNARIFSKDNFGINAMNVAVGFVVLVISLVIAFAIFPTAIQQASAAANATSGAAATILNQFPLILAASLLFVGVGYMVFTMKKGGAGGGE